MSKSGCYTRDPALLLSLLKKTEGIKGDVVEVGVLRGHKFKLFCQNTKRICHAIDSFRGMAEPEEGDGNYPAGKFNVGGPSRLIRETKNMSNARIHAGWIPEVLPDIKEISLVHIDVDTRRPTAQTLEWAWPRVVPGGILVVHDYIHNHFEIGCRFAYKDFVDQVGLYTGLKDTWAWWVKEDTDGHA